MYMIPFKVNFKKMQASLYVVKTINILQTEFIFEDYYMALEFE